MEEGQEMRVPGNAKKPGLHRWLGRLVIKELSEREGSQGIKFWAEMLHIWSWKK